MTTNQQKAQSILDTNPNANELSAFLESYLKNPSIYIYVDGHGRPTGFIAMDKDGQLFHTYRTIGAEVTHNLLNHSNNKAKGIITGLVNRNEELEKQVKNISQWLNIMCILFLVCLIFIAYLFHFYVKKSHEMQSTSDAISSISIQKPLTTYDEQ